ncbi:DUF4123 domain-containing protein [Arhodomonas aquaeolei]|uniref:DUF4123 domain-containing protein n=1 Tax=Arhodomonas aquaeolei TaxID=2369 RepID=UPI000372BECE|nr:DUF4123 domain-containing protein [Arhodomonas aquaeolei]
MQLIDDYPKGWLDDTRQLIGGLRQSAPEGHVHLLVDAAFRHEHVLPWLRRHLPPKRWHAVYADMPGPDGAALAISPMVIEPLAPEHWEALFELARGLPMLTLIATPESVTGTAQRLARFSIVTVQDTAYGLRLADTRLLPALLALFSGEQHGAFMGPGTWHCLGRDARWQPLPPAHEPAAPAERVTFDDQQTEALLRINEVDALIEILRDSAPALFGVFDSPSQRHEWLSTVLAQAPESVRDHARRLDYCRRMARRQGLLPAATADETKPDTDPSA